MLRSVDGHPYAFLHADAAAGLDAQLGRLAAAGLPYRGDLDTPLRPFPTAIGGLRAAAIVPEAQAAALDPWHPDEGLFLLGIARFRDAWPEFAARNLERQAWPHGPARIESGVATLPGLAGLNNLNSLTLARLFDDPAWRTRALDALRDAMPRSGSWRVGPARHPGARGSSGGLRRDGEPPGPARLRDPDASSVDTGAAALRRAALLRHGAGRLRADRIRGRGTDPRGRPHRGGRDPCRRAAAPDPDRSGGPRHGRPRGRWPARRPRRRGHRRRRRPPGQRPRAWIVAAGRPVRARGRGTGGGGHPRRRGAAPGGSRRRGAPGEPASGGQRPRRDAVPDRALR